MLPEKLYSMIEQVLSNRWELQHVELKKQVKELPKSFMIPCQGFQISMEEVQ